MQFIPFQKRKKKEKEKKEEGEDGYRITEKSVGKEKWSKRSSNQIWLLAKK